MKPLYSINETPFINGPTVTGDEFCDLLGFLGGEGEYFGALQKWNRN